MAKNKKSKILAMALCAGVMAGIYASPVMATELWQNNAGTVVTERDNRDIKITQLEGLESIISDSFATTPINGNSAFWVNDDGKLVAANRQFTVDTNGSVYISPNGVQREATVVLNADTGIVTATNFATEDYNLVDIGNKTQNINSWTTADTTAFDGSVIADSFGTTKVNGNRAFWVNKDGMMEAAYGKFAVDAEGNIKTVGTVDGVDVSALRDNVGGISGNVDDLEYKTQNIDKNRTGNGYTTFNGALNTDGTIRAAGGAVELRGNWETDGTLNLRYTNGQYESLTATQLGNINSTIKEGGVVDATELHVEGTYGSLHVKDVANEAGEQNTMIYVEDKDGNDTLYIDPATGNLVTKGALSAGDGAFVANKNGIAVGEKFSVSAENGGVQAVEYKINDANVFNASGLTASAGNVGGVEIANGEVDGVDVSKLSTAATDISDLQNRTQYITGASHDTTYFKGAIRSTGDISSGNGAVTLSGNYEKEAAVTLRDAEGKRYALTATQLGNINNMITGAGVLENVVSINGAAVEGVGNGGLKISGVELENGLINGVNINDLDKAVAGTSANISGIEREAEDGAAPGEGTTTIENNLKVSGDKINMFGDAGLTFDKGTMNGVNVINVSGNIGFNGSNVHFSYGSDGKTTTLGGLALTVDQIATDVSAIKEKTDHITVDDKGNVTISADDGSSLTVGKDGTSTGQGGQVTTDGNHTVNGDLDVDGSGQIDKDLTVGGDLEVGGSITTGNTTIDGSGMTVGDGTTITDGKVSSTEGAFGNITSNTGNIGNATFDENGMTVGTADKGTTVSDSGVSIKNEYGSVETGVVDGKNDVVVTDEDGNRTSLVDTAGRVENLEQGVAELNNRVGELEDRIDKVGAMAAAIANLRTMGYDPAAPTEVAVGLGQYRDETGAALGLFHYPNRDFMLSLSVSTSGDEVMGGIGATWKFGRKSPEKVAEIKKAQAEADARRAEEAKLAKAEEMKQAAKEAKIKAQQERHAKLAAERAAQAEAAK